MAAKNKVFWFAFVLLLSLCLFVQHSLSNDQQNSGANSHVDESSSTDSTDNDGSDSSETHRHHAMDGTQDQELRDNSRINEAESKNENVQIEQISEQELSQLMAAAENERAFMNFEKATELYRQLGERGATEAYYQAAKMLLFDAQGDQYANDAVSFLDLASKRGHAASQHLRAFMLSIGLGNTEPNVPLALLHYHFAAAGNSTEAQMAMGFRHKFGEGLERSCRKALGYYSLAAKKVAATVQSIGYVGRSTERKRIAELDHQQGTANEKGVIEHIQWAASHGDVQHMVTMGNLYLHSLYGVKQNFHEAFLYFQRASHHNHPEAWGQLGNMYLQGLGTTQNFPKAFECYSKGAALEHHLSFNGLGYMYLKGIHVERNYEEAYKYFDKAVNAGSVEGKLNLGIMYLEGRGVQVDNAKAYVHFSMAARSGHTLALYYMGLLHEVGVGAAYNCPIALQNYKVVVERGNTGDIIDIAQLKYQQGEYSTALILNDLASELGFEIAQSNAAYLYENQLGYDKSDHMTHALQRYRQSALQGNVKSKLRVGDAYYYGHSVAKDFEVAAAHYNEAVQAGSAQAMFNLGYMHQYGEGVPKDLHLAKRFYDMAASTSPEAYVPTRLALAVWAVHFVVENYILSPGLVTSLLALVDLETFLIVFLLNVLMLLIVRRQIVVNRRNNLQEQQQQQQQQQQQ
eukprot:TRINITY_DN4137_c0_g1_i10.p1 TRINITY_DN4137_c0_g1~~TRINITY_DN4137_c0_g1_i10.p1  ORF type:complete len:687 (-),score=151.47 TRINITY_DN4137_c0_g1_i10:1418-3478(-)